MKRILAFAVVLAAAVFMFSGCVTANAYYSLLKENENIMEINKGLESRIAAAKEQYGTWKSKVAELERQVSYYREIAEAGKRTIKQLSELDNDLRAGASQVDLRIAAPAEAGEGEITIAGGKIRILGEVLFRAGSHELSAKGRATIVKVATMLKDPRFSNYYIRVDGHTDNQPLRVTKGKYHTNWLLGAYRAHSVLQVLMKEGIPRNRAFIASFGEYTPPESVAGANLNSAAARRKCRRVEIALVASK